MPRRVDSRESGKEGWKGWWGHIVTGPLLVVAICTFHRRPLHAAVDLRSVAEIDGATQTRAL